MPKQFCPIGHNTFIVGRQKSNGRCISCSISDTRKWKLENPDKLRKSRSKYFQEHKGLFNMHVTKRRVALIKRIPIFGQEGIKEFYQNRPKGYDIDHIVPLRAINASGLHVIWNLQYLPISENRSKRNTFCTNAK